MEKSETVFDSYNNIKEEKVNLMSLVSYTEIPEDKDAAKNLISKNHMTYTKCFSLINNKWKFVPLGWHQYFHGTNGFAAGNTLEEAILQGLHEVIERHHIARSFRKAFKTLDTTGLDGTPLDILSIERDDLEIFLFDITGDISIPTAYCAILDKTENGQMCYAQRMGHDDGSRKISDKTICQSSYGCSSKKIFNSKQYIPCHL